MLKQLLEPLHVKKIINFGKNRFFFFAKYSQWQTDLELKKVKQTDLMGLNSKGLIKYQKKIQY
jgi:hypothetical protein